MSEKPYTIKHGKTVAVFEFDLEEARALYDAIPAQYGKDDSALKRFDAALVKALDELAEL